ncbi:MAG TPA: hypothetical protein VMY42_06060 [Thermoguttaceae bacterium]|nr:hypothetical protein [Thermoguttaceae bacterium]
MKARFVSIVLFSLISLSYAVPAEADWVVKFLHSVARDTKRRNCWPEPFVSADRYDAHVPFAIMADNGWRRQNMLGDYHFFDEKAELTEAGRLKVRSILTEAPQQHRTIYVHKALDADITAARVLNIQAYAVNIAPDGGVPPVLTTDISARGWPASRVDVIGRKFESSIPEPRLPGAGGGEGGS